MTRIDLDEGPGGAQEGGGGGEGGRGEEGRGSFAACEGPLALSRKTRQTGRVCTEQTRYLCTLHFLDISRVFREKERERERERESYSLCLISSY